MNILLLPLLFLPRFLHLSDERTAPLSHRMTDALPLELTADPRPLFKLPYRLALPIDWENHKSALSDLLTPAVQGLRVRPRRQFAWDKLSPLTIPFPGLADFVSDPLLIVNGRKHKKKRVEKKDKK